MCESITCPVHTRVDNTMRDEPTRSYSAITYVGKYAVMTDVHPVWLDMAVVMVAQMMELPLPSEYQTCVIEVGEGCIADVVSDNDEAVYVAWSQGHDDYESLQDAHDMIVGAVQAETLDLTGKVLYGGM